MIGLRDYAVLGLFLAFMLTLGVVFRRFNKDTSDYFRGGGSMLWWLAGSSAMMGALSAWSFTGAAAEIYETGPVVAVLYLSNAAAAGFVYLFTGERFRRMRVVTYVEAIRRRFGEATGHCYLWATLPSGILFSGIQLYAVSVFFAAVFHAPLLGTLFALSSAVIFMAMLGGAWAVVAGDFLRLLMTFLVLLAAVWYSLEIPQLGGWHGLLAKAPPQYRHWTLSMRSGILAIWAVGTFVNSLVDFNNLGTGAARFLVVKDGVQARKAALAVMIFFIAISVLLLLPPMVAAATGIDLKAAFPQLARPHEAAFVAACLRTMPPGVIGLLAAGIFAVAMAAMDTGLNRNVGIFIRNFYGPVLRPKAGDKELLAASKLATLAFGLVILGVACAILAFSSMSLFSLMQFGIALVQFPLGVPLLLGMFSRETPRWAGWSTAAIGVVTALLTMLFVPRIVSEACGWAALSARESARLGFGITILSTGIVELGWFFFARSFGRQPASGEVKRFFDDLDRPIDVEREILQTDSKQYSTVGILCLVYGLATSLLTLMPNTVAGHTTFLVFGGAMAGLGFSLRASAPTVAASTSMAETVKDRI